MIEITPEKFFLGAGFFDKSTPNFPVAMAVIEKHNPGRVWMDQLENPSICLIITNGSYSFIGIKGEKKIFASGSNRNSEK